MSTNENNTKRKLLSFFKNNSGKFVSGEEISSKLGFSRAAVWKYMKKLKEEGFLIEAVPRLGYRLKKIPDKLYAYDLQGSLGSKIIGRKNIIYHDELASTNDMAYALAEEGAEEGTVVIAEKQTKGKGRMGRKWWSPEGGGLYFSIILRPLYGMEEIAGLTLVAAVAIAEAVKRTTSLKAIIKWPNDILLNGRKFCGILTEIKAEPDKIDFLILGIGLNVNTPLKKLPQHGTSLREEAKKRIDRKTMLVSIIEEFEKKYTLFQQAGFSALRDDCRKLSSVIGKNVSIKQHEKTISGKALDIDQTGALLIEEASGGINRVLSGDIIV